MADNYMDFEEHGGLQIKGQLEFDCAAKAEREGQPKPFVLIASDPTAPWLIEIWEAVSRGDTETALGCFAGMVDTCINRYKQNPRSADKLDSAAEIAINMRNWRLEKSLK